MKTKRAKINRTKLTNKIAHRDMVLGPFERLVSTKGTYALVCHTDRGVIIDQDAVGRRAFYLKWVDRPRSKVRGRLVFKIQLMKEDIQALLNQYDHLLIHLGGADYPYCIITRAEFLGMGVSVGSCIEVTYQRGDRKYRVAGGTVTADHSMRIEVRRFWHSAQPKGAPLATAA